MPCTNITISTIHWDQYFRRISGAPSLVGIRNEAKFRTVVEVARDRDRIRNQHLEESVRLSKSADLGKLKGTKTGSYVPGHSIITCSPLLVRTGFPSSMYLESLSH